LDGSPVGLFVGPLDGRDEGGGVGKLEGLLVG
jgi:hypothetical protein